VRTSWLVELLSSALRTVSGTEGTHERDAFAKRGDFRVAIAATREERVLYAW